MPVRYATLEVAMEGSLLQTDASGGVLPNAPLFTAAAHELKSPLALVRQLSLGISSGELSKKEIIRAAEQISLTSERALRLTSDLTRTARLDDSLFSLEPLNPLALCQEVLTEIQPLYIAQGKKITLRSRKRPLLAVANRDLLRRVLLGFADNALHYTDAKSPVTITAAIVGNGEAVRVGVRDFGPALPKMVISNAGRRPATVHSRPESSGLGVYIARQFADAMNGKIGTIQHRDGATFYIEIGTSRQLRLL